MFASINNQIDNAKVFMEAGADPFLRDEDVRSISNYFISFSCL